MFVDLLIYSCIASRLPLHAGEALGQLARQLLDSIVDCYCVYSYCISCMCVYYCMYCLFYCCATAPGRSDRRLLFIRRFHRNTNSSLIVKGSTSPSRPITLSPDVQNPYVSQLWGGPLMKMTPILPHDVPEQLD